MGAGVLQPEPPSKCYLYVGRMDFQGTTAWLSFSFSHCVYSCCRDGEAHMEVRGHSEVGSLGDQTQLVRLVLLPCLRPLIYSGIKEQHPSDILRETEFEIDN